MPSTPPQSRARSPKGEQTLRAILDAGRAIVAQEGIAGVSQEAVAQRAGISQSALRHYFPSKEGLLRALFDDVLGAHVAGFQQIMLEPGDSPAVRLTKMVHAHLDAITGFDDAIMLEVFAFWARNADAARGRREFHVWVVGHYADTIQALRPDLSLDECREIAVQVLTLTLGAWLTLGRSRPHLLDRSARRVKEVLLRAVDALVGVSLPW